MPQIARLFLPDVPDSQLQTTTAQPNTTYSAETPGNITADLMTTEGPIINPPIEYPYAIVGGITALVGLAELVIFFFRGDTLKVDKKAGGRKMFKVSSWIQGYNKGLTLSFILLLFVFWSLPIGMCDTT